jgi:hypothetical protein
VGLAGIEPARCEVETRCSVPLSYRPWWAAEELNPVRAGNKPAALTDELAARKYPRHELNAHLLVRSQPSYPLDHEGVDALPGVEPGISALQALSANPVATRCVPVDGIEPPCQRLRLYRPPSVHRSQPTWGDRRDVRPVAAGSQPAGSLRCLRSQSGRQDSNLRLLAPRASRLSTTVRPGTCDRSRTCMHLNLNQAARQMAYARAESGAVEAHR